MSTHPLPSNLLRLSLSITLLLTLALLLSSAASAASVKAKNGNIYFINDAGISARLTRLKSDTQPVLSPDKTKIAFVRTLPKREIQEADKETWMQATADTEIWMIDTTGADAHRVVATHIENDNNEKNLAQFNSLVFSLDGRQLYFLSKAWVTSDGLHVVNLANHQVQYLTDANDVRVISQGKYAGYLIVEKHNYSTGPEGGSYDAFWLITAYGAELKMLGKTEAAVVRFIKTQL